MKYILSPSILAADFNNLGLEMKKTEENGAKYLHFDVMDGMFVPSISFGIPVLESIHNTTDQVMDVHLMIEEPIRYVKEFKNAGADILTIHLEACKDVLATIEKIRELGMRVGLAISPETEVEKLLPYLELVDMILVMGVRPGFGGQKFIPKTLERVHTVRTLLDEKNLKVDIQVDGGICLDNLREVLDAGVNVIVAGSAIFKGDVAENTRRFMEILREYE